VGPSDGRCSRHGRRRTGTGRGLNGASPYTSTGLTVVKVPDGGEQAAWEQVRGHSEGRLTDWGIKILGSGLKGYVKSILIEPRYVCRDYRDLFSSFYSRKFLPRSSFCSRLHFFAEPDLTVDGAVFEPDRHAKSYIGYSVIQPVRDRCIGRTMIDPEKVGKPKDVFYCLRTATKVHINGVEYAVQGYPFISQSKEAMVCSHAALWGVCRYLSERCPAYGEVRPYGLIELTGRSSGRRVPYRGMTYEDYCEILAAFGCHPVALFPRETNQTDWTKDRETFFDIYSYVESGFPVLASIGGHVTALIGHTVNKDLGLHTVDKSRYHNSFSLVKQFIAVDDNFFPYQLLGYSSDRENYAKAFKRSTYIPSLESIIAAVVPLPEKAFLTPQKARKLAYTYFDRASAKIDDVLKELNCTGEPLVARLFLTSTVSFKKRKRRCAIGKLGEGPDALSLLPVDLNLPHFVWVMELSPLSLHNSGLCVGEVVLDASASEDECEYVYLRIGKTVLRGAQEGVFAPGHIRFAQYTHNLGERDA